MSARLEYTEGVRLWPAWFHAAYLCRSFLCPAIRANGPSKNSMLPSPALNGVCPAFEPHTPPPSGSGVGSGVGTTTVAVGVGGTGVDVGVTGVAVGVTVGRGVTVGGTGVFVGVVVGGTGVAVGVGISVAVGVGLLVGVGGTGVEVGVGDGVGDGDGVIVGVGVGVGVGSPVNTRSKFLLVAPLTYSAVFLDFTPFRKNSITRPSRLESSGSTTRFRYAPPWMRAGRDS